MSINTNVDHRDGQSIYIYLIRKREFIEKAGQKQPQKEYTGCIQQDLGLYKLQKVAKTPTPLFGQNIYISNFP